MLVAEVRASIGRAAGASLDELATALPAPVASRSGFALGRRTFPSDIAVQRRVLYEALADAIMYRQVLAELADERGWSVHLFSAKDVLAQATAVLADRADGVLDCPHARFGPRWTKDHRMALAAAIVSG